MNKTKPVPKRAPARRKTPAEPTSLTLKGGSKVDLRAPWPFPISVPPRKQ